MNLIELFDIKSKCKQVISAKLDCLKHQFDHFWGVNKWLIYTLIVSNTLQYFEPFFFDNLC